MLRTKPLTHSSRAARSGAATYSSLLLTKPLCCELNLSLTPPGRRDRVLLPTTLFAHLETGIHASYTPLTRLLHASYTPPTRLLHASYTPLLPATLLAHLETGIHPLTRHLHGTPLTRLLHASATCNSFCSYTPLTRLLHASYTPLLPATLFATPTLSTASRCIGRSLRSTN
jgi:hypothetical protein